MREHRWDSPLGKFKSKDITSFWLQSPIKPVESLPAKLYQHRNRVTFISDIHKMSTKAREKCQVTDTLSQYHILSPVLLPGETSYNPFLTERPQQNCSRAIAGSWSSSEMLLSCVRAAQITILKIHRLEVTGEAGETEVQGSLKQLCCANSCH